MMLSIFMSSLATSVMTRSKPGRTGAGLVLQKQWGDGFDDLIKQAATVQLFLLYNFNPLYFAMSDVLRTVVLHLRTKWRSTA